MVEKPDFDDSFKAAFGLVISELEGADSVSVATLLAPCAIIKVILENKPKLFWNACMALCGNGQHTRPM